LLPEMEAVGVVAEPRSTPIAILGTAFIH
jgi:hypothetical protein